MLGPVGNLARFAPILSISRAKSDLPPSAPTGMFDGSVQPRKPAPNTVASFLSQFSSNVVASFSCALAATGFLTGATLLTLVLPAAPVINIPALAGE